MDELIWTEDLDVGNKIVDFQHKKIFTYLNTLIVASNDKNTDMSTLKKMLDSLIAYTVLHFDDEEQLLKSIGYQDLEQHKKIHRACAKQILGFKQRLESGEDVLAELIAFVESWIIVHIKQEDMKALRSKD